MIEPGTHASWLMSCPCGDGNFAVHLKAAELDELKTVLESLPEQGNKTKKNVIAKEIRKREAKAST